MAMIEINRNPSPKELRLFGGVLLPLFLFLVGGFVALKTSRWLWVLYVGLPGLPVAAVGWIRPGLLRGLYVGWMYAVWPIGIAVSHLLLGAIYYLLVTPIGLLRRLLGGDPLKRRFDPSAKSYWTPRREGDTMERYVRQY
jgi:hypothetical protein